MTKYAHALVALWSHWIMKYCYCQESLLSGHILKNTLCYLDCVCGIKLLPDSSVSQFWTLGDHPSLLRWLLCHMTVTWLILFSHTTFMWGHTTAITSHMVSLSSNHYFWESAVASHSCLCPRLLDTGSSPLSVCRSPLNPLIDLICSSILLNLSSLCGPAIQVS